MSRFICKCAILGSNRGNTTVRIQHKRRNTDRDVGKLNSCIMCLDVDDFASICPNSIKL